jgi:uncharacterized membrane protein
MPILIAALAVVCGAFAAVFVEEQLMRHGTTRSKRDQWVAGAGWMLFAAFLITLGYQLSGRHHG